MAEVFLTVVTQYVKTGNLLQSTSCGRLHTVLIPEEKKKKKKRPNQIYFY